MSRCKLLVMLGSVLLLCALSITGITPSHASTGSNTVATPLHSHSALAQTWPRSGVASAHTISLSSIVKTQVVSLPNASGGGGCSEYPNGDIGSCITINSSGYIVPNAYTSVAAAELDIVLYRNGSEYSEFIWHGPVAPGHYIYPSSKWVPKSMTGTWVAASSLEVGNTTYDEFSPAQFT